MINKDKDELDKKLVRGDESALVELYDTYKPEFLNFFRKWDINDESILDIYQESVIVIYQKFLIANHELKLSSVKTYLFGIGKHKVYDYFKSKAITTNALEELKVESKAFELKEEPNLYEQTLAKNLKLISENCQQLLKLFYYRGLSIKDIVAKTDYKDENTVKSYKSRCLKKLKDLCNL